MTDELRSCEVGRSSSTHDTQHDDDASSFHLRRPLFISFLAPRFSSKAPPSFKSKVSADDENQSSSHCPFCFCYCCCCCCCYWPIELIQTQSCPPVRPLVCYSLNGQNKWRIERCTAAKDMQNICNAHAVVQPTSECTATSKKQLTQDTRAQQNRAEQQQQQPGSVHLSRLLTHTQQQRRSRPT